MFRNVLEFREVSEKPAVSTMKNEREKFSKILESFRHITHHSLKKFPALRNSESNGYWLIDYNWFRDLYWSRCTQDLIAGPLCPMSNYGSPVTLLKFQMAPTLILLMSPGSKKKEPRYACLNEAKASHSQRMWAEVSSFTPHLLHSGLSSSPSRWRCLPRVLCPVRRPVTALDWVLLKDRNPALGPRQGPEISSRACLWISPRPRKLLRNGCQTVLSTILNR